MTTWGFGLRAKSMFALALACILVLLPTGLIAWNTAEHIRAHFGEAYARNFTLLNREKILAPIAHDLALSLRLAESEVLRQWLLDKENPSKKEAFFRETEGYRRDFRGRSYFLIDAHNLHYYFNDIATPFSDQPRYTLKPDNPADNWFFTILDTIDRYNINVNQDLQLRTTRVWLNVIVLEDTSKIGLVGTGLDLGEFLRSFISVDEPGVTPIILDEAGYIQAHPDERLIAYGSTTGAQTHGYMLADLLPGAEQRGALSSALAQSRLKPGNAASINIVLDGREQLLSISYLPELKWHVLTAVDLRAAHIFEHRWLWIAAGTLFLPLALLFVTLAYALEKLVLTPLSTLHQSATAIAQGNFDVAFPSPRRDEIGDLSRNFNAMANQVKAHTQELENRVQERTAALEYAHAVDERGPSENQRFHRLCQSYSACLSA